MLWKIHNKFSGKVKPFYVGYGAWFLIWGDEAWDDGNTKNWDGWKQIDSGLRSGSPCSYWTCSSFVSPYFGERSQFLLELRNSRSRLDLFCDGCSSGCGIEIEWRWSRTAEAICDNQHIEYLNNTFQMKLKIIRF